MKPEVFKNTPVTKWITSDSDGTIAPFVKVEDKDKAKPDKEFIDAIRQQSFENPDTVFMIISGRQAWELPGLYENIFLPNEEGKLPKIVIASENGAHMQFKHIDPSELSDENRSHKNILQFATPLDDTAIGEIEKIIKDAMGEEHYTRNVKDTSPDKWIKAEVKNYGFTFHESPPKDEASLSKYNEAKAKIKTEFTDYGEKHNLLVHLDAASAMTMEKISKGATMEKIIKGDKDMSVFFRENGLVTAEPTWMTYSGDDVGDRAALRVLNNAFKEGKVEGYTSCPSNYTPYDPEGRTPNNPKDSALSDSFFILGSTTQLAQEQHKVNITNPKNAEELNNLRKALSDTQLMPSQSGSPDTPPIVLLTNNDILIQEPHRYSEEALNELKNWDRGKVVLLADTQETTALQDIAKANSNVYIASTNGLIQGKGQKHDFESDLNKAVNENVVISKDPKVSEQMQLLRGWQSVLSNKGILTNPTMGASSSLKGLKTSSVEKSALKRKTSVQSPKGSKPAKEKSRPLSYKR